MNVRLCGVYAIIHTDTARAYIGSSRSIETRWRTHTSDLRGGRHHSSHLQHAWTKYGEPAFEFVLLEQCDEALLFQREQDWMDVLRTHDAAHGFNMSSLAHVAAMSDEGRARISAGRRGKKFGPRSEATRQAIAAGNRGKPLTEERRQKISAAHQGKKRGPQSDEHHARIAAKSSQHRHSPEVREKIRANHWSRSPQAAVIASRLTGRRKKSQNTTEEAIA